MEKLEALLGVGLVARAEDFTKSTKNFTSWNGPPFQSKRPISWRLIAFMNYPYLIAEISWSSGSLLSDRWWTTVRSAVAACHFASPSSRGGEPTTCCNICGSMQCLCSLARAAWCGMDCFWPHESSTNQKEGHNIRICFFLQVHPPCINKKYIYEWSLIKERAEGLCRLLILVLGTM